MRTWTVVRRTLIVALVAGGLAWVGPAPGAEQTGPAASESPDSSSMPPGKARELFQKAKADAEAARSGGEGYDIWEEFLKVCTDPAYKGLAEAELKIWKDRREKNLVKVGNGSYARWMPAPEVAEGTAKSDELVAKADAASDVAEAARLYDEAFRAFPYRPDALFRKAVRYFKAQNNREASKAWGEVISKLDRENVAALNNIGLLAAVNAPTKLWDAALANLTKAASLCDDDRVWDNLDAVIGAGSESGLPDAWVEKADGGVRGAVTTQRTRFGRHKTETRWGNRWIAEIEYQKMLKENMQAKDKARAVQVELLRIKQAQARVKARIEKLTKAMEEAIKRLAQPEAQATAAKPYKDEITKLEAEMKKANFEGAIDALDARIKELESKKNTPARADQYVLLEADGKSELATLDVLKDEPKEKEGELTKPRGKGAELFNK